MLNKVLFFVFGIFVSIFLYLFIIPNNKLDNIKIIDSNDNIRAKYGNIDLIKVNNSIVSIVSSKTMRFVSESNGLLGDNNDIFEKSIDLAGASGFFVATGGFVITNKHVVNDKDLSYRVLDTNGNSYNVDKIWYHDLYDIALLKITNNLNINIEIVKFADNHNIQKGDIIYSIGNVLSKFPSSFVIGYISNISISEQFINNQIYSGLYLLQIPSTSGNSGSPVFNFDGNVIGVITAMSNINNNFSFMIPFDKNDLDEMFIHNIN